MKYKILFGKTPICFNIKYKKRKAIKITVNPDLSVEVFAPENSKKEQVFNIVKKKSLWILNQIDYFGSFLPNESEKEYISGESHRYLGRQYKLKIIQSDFNYIKLFKKNITIFSSNKESEHYNKLLLYEWYKERARKKFNIVLEKISDKLRKYEIRYDEMKIRKMKTRWGSCHSLKKSITLNLELIKVSMYCIEYVVLHELAHIKYKNHNKIFYNFLTTVMPDWKKRKKKLEAVID